MDSLIHDLRYGFRMLLKSPGLGVAAILTLALGMGANIAMFSLADAMWLRPLPVPEANRLVRVYTSDPSQTRGEMRGETSYADFLDLRASLKTMDVTTVQRRGALIEKNGETHLYRANQISDNYFEVVGVRPAAGHLPTEREMQAPDAPPEVVISYEYWQGEYGGDPGTIGKDIIMARRHYTIVGVLPPQFRPGERFADQSFWVPLTSWMKQDRGDSAMLPRRDARYWEVMGRLRPGATLEQAQAELDTIAGRLASEYPKTNAGRRMTVVLETKSRPESTQKLGVLLLAMAGLVLLIACANVANLLLARGEHRRREVATRLALGATRLRILRQFFAENLLLGSIGCAAAFVVAYWTLAPVPAILASGVLRIDLDAHIDARAMIFAALAVILSVLLFGTFPAFQAIRQELVATLKSQGTNSSADRGRVWMRNALVVLQMSVSLALIIVTGLLLRTVDAARRLNPGFDTQQQMVIADVAPMSYSERELPQLFRDLEQQLSALPGVRHASVSGRVPLGPSGGGIQANVFVPGHVAPDGSGVAIGYTAVSDTYFDTLGTRLLRGRTFSSADTPQTPRVAVVNQTMARRFWGNSDPVGETFRIDGSTGPEYRVVGVVQDGKYNDISEQVVAYMFFSLNQRSVGEFAVAVATSGDAQALVTPIRKVLSGGGKSIVMHVDTMNGFMRDALYDQRVTAQLTGALGVLGVVLAAFGLYGVISFLVGHRTREIGVRMALGAPREAIFRLFLTRGLRLALAGVVIGCGAAMALGRLVGSMLYGVSPRDPLTFTVAAVLLVAVAFAATYFPARRATRIEPMEALRYE